LIFFADVVEIIEYSDLTTWYWTRVCLYGNIW